jgi:hypothetical protein
MMMAPSCVNSLAATISTALALTSGFTSMQLALCASRMCGKTAAAVVVKKYKSPSVNPSIQRATHVTTTVLICDKLLIVNLSALANITKEV